MGYLILSIFMFAVSVFYGFCGVGAFQDYLKQPPKQKSGYVNWCFLDLPAGNVNVAQTQNEIFFESPNGRKIKFVRQEESKEI